LVYSARIALDWTTMEVESGSVNLSPGMAVTVEVKTGSRRIISYPLSPLLKFKQEAPRNGETRLVMKSDFFPSCWLAQMGLPELNKKTSFSVQSCHEAHLTAVRLSAVLVF
jgi:hypothetical protein